jgi:hypothetical protein
VATVNGQRALQIEVSHRPMSVEYSHGACLSPDATGRYRRKVPLEERVINWKAPQYKAPQYLEGVLEEIKRVVACMSGLMLLDGTPGGVYAAAESGDALWRDRGRS